MCVPPRSLTHIVRAPLTCMHRSATPRPFFPRRTCCALSRLRMWGTGKRRYNIKLWKTFTDCFNCLPIAAIIDEKIFTMHGGLSPDLQSMEQIRRVMRPTDVPDTGPSPCPPYVIPADRRRRRPAV